MSNARHKILAGSALLASVALVTACSTTDEGSSSDGTTELTILWQSGDQNSLDAVIASFEEDYPDITITPTYVAPADMQQTMRTQFAAGTMTDLTWVWPGNGNVGAIDVIAPAGYLVDLSDEPWVEDLPDDVRDLSSVDGATYAFMTQLTAWGALYNQDAMDAAGLEIPTTWSEVLQFCADAKSLGLSAYALGTATNYETQNTPYSLYPELVETGDADGLTALADGEATFADTAWKTVIEKTQEMAEAGCHNDGFQGTDVDTAHNLWAAGDSLAITSIGQYLSIPDATVTIAPLPGTDDASASEVGLAPFGGLAINAASDKIDAAKVFVEYMATPEHDTQYVYAAGGGDGSTPAASGSIPVLQDEDNLPTDSVSLTLLQLQSEGRTGTFPDQLWPNPEVQANMYSGLQSLYSGDATVDDVLASMQEAYDEGGVE
ncbi:MAG: ABC transporter substrate-binding protein [Microbacteriaceae bacterium]